MDAQSRVDPVILIIEDNDATRKVVRVTLRQSGYTLLEASDGATAIELMSHGDPAPNLILQDLILPDMNGFDLVRRLRRLPGGADVPILAFSSFLSGLDEAHMLAAGFNGVLIKPVEPSRLIGEIEPYLRPEVAVVSPRRGPRVLVVDDDPIQLKLTRVALSGFGFGVTVAGTAEEGLAAAARERPDAVLSDVLMADMDGFELCARLRTDLRTHQTPVVLITNHYAGEEDVALARRMGAYDLLVRTPDLAEAATRLRSAIGSPATPVPELGDFTELQRAYLKRITTHLGRQVEANVGMSQRIALLTASMSVLGTVARLLGSAANAERALQEVLTQCIAAGGLSRGAVFLRQAQGRAWACVAQVGFGVAQGKDFDSLFGHPDLLEATLDHGEPLVLSGGDRDPDVQSLLARCGASSAVLAEVDPGPDQRGVLLLFSALSAISGKEWSGFAQTIAGQLGQALALSEAFRQLSVSEQQHRVLIDSVQEYAIIMLDPQGRVATWNNGAERLFGHAPDVIVGTHLSAFFTEEERSRGLPADLLKRAADRGKARAEGWRLRSDGSHFWGETTLAPVRSPDGRLTGFAEVTRDFTDRRRAEELFRCAFEAAPNGMIMVDRNGAIVLANNRFTEMFGHDKDRVLGVSIESLLPERFRRGHIAFRGAYTAAPTARGMGRGRDLAALRADGSEFPVEIGLNPVELEGEPYIIASIVDITERKRAELALASREARVRALMEGASDGISVLSADGHIQETNRRWAEILGLPIEEIVGRHIAEFAADPENLTRFQKSIRSATARIEGLRVRRADGSVRVVDISQSVTYIDEQPVVFTIARDVTQQQLLEKQLLQSQKMEAVGRLAGGVAHDFNNLLTAIQGNATFLREGLADDAELLGDVDEVLRAAERAAGLTRQLLAFSRQQVLAPRVVDLTELVRSTEKMLARLIGEDVEIVTALDPATGRVFGDPGQIEQVIMNLAVNARDALVEGGKLTIETTNVDVDEDYVEQHADVQPGPYVLLAVSDTGIGMSRDVQAKIFEPFFTTKEPGRGTGLGLATVYGIVKQSGGFVWVYSEPGQGTTFKVYFPRVGQAADAPSFPADARPPRGHETVLVAEDDPMVRRLLVRSLETLGYEVLTAGTPQEVLALARTLSEPVSLLITDVVMPGMSGRALAEQLLELWPGLRVLYSSGYTDDAIVRHGLLSEGIAFLQKPYTPAIVARKVREVLDG